MFVTTFDIFLQFLLFWLQKILKSSETSPKNKLKGPSLVARQHSEAGFQKRPLKEQPNFSDNSFSDNDSLVLKTALFAERL